MSLDVYLYDRTNPCKRECCQEPVYQANYTHNCGPMAKEAGLYDAVWRPDENGIETAAQLIPILEAGIATMKADPARFEALNPSNGWGSYDTFMPWLERYLAACREYPDVKVEVTR